MTIGTTITNAQGVVSTNNTTGLSVQQDVNNVGFSPFPVQGVTALISTSAGGNTPVVTPGEAGILTLSGSGAILTVALPTAASAVGGTYVFRNLDARAHILSNSLETPGVLNIVSGAAALKTKVTMNATVGASVELTSDGLNWFYVTGWLPNSAS